MQPKTYEEAYFRRNPDAPRHSLPVCAMSSTERRDVGMFFSANEGSTCIPDIPGRMMTTTRRHPAAPAPAEAEEEEPLHRHSSGLRCSQEIARNVGIENDVVYPCGRCGAHRSMGYRCCGRYAGMNGEVPVPRRNVHEHPRGGRARGERLPAGHSCPAQQRARRFVEDGRAVLNSI